MWSRLLLLLFVGIATASNPAWKVENEYVYQVYGRTLTGLYDVHDQYTGVVLRAKLTIRPLSEDVLSGVISNMQYARVHAYLPKGWSSELVDSKLDYQTLTFTEKPFEILMKNGYIYDLVVDKEVQNWEDNIIKSFVSQIQLDTNAEHLIGSHVNQLPEENTNMGVYKTMEETVTGKYETLYEINPLPEYVLKDQPYLVPLPQLRGNGHVLEVIKTKNFSRADERVDYHYGFSLLDQGEPASNQMGEYFSRTSISRAILSGYLKSYTIQSSVTTNKIILSPTLNNKQKGMVVSQLNVTLHSMQPKSTKNAQIANSQRLGGLIYRYEEPFSSNYEARPVRQRTMNYDSSRSSSSSSSSSEEHYKHRDQGENKIRYPRSIDDVQQQNTLEENHSSSSSSSSSSSESYEQYWQRPELNLPPESPLLPYYVGYKGKSLKTAPNVNVVQSVQKLARQIAQQVQNPEVMPKEQTLSKYVVLNSLTRIMDEDEMKKTAQQLYSKEQGPVGSAWIVYRDSIAEAGTSPALLTIQEWILTNKISGEEAAEVITTMSNSVRQPTVEYMRQYYVLVTKPEVQSQKYLYDAAILSYSELIRRVYVDRYYSHNQYPVHSFGNFYTPEGVDFVKNEYIPYLSKQLDEAVKQGDRHKIHLYIRSLGNVGHYKILEAFEPYMEGKKQVSQFQRLQMVLALDRLVKVYPKQARSVLYKIYQNPSEHSEIRCAAVYQLMRTSPPTSMLQRMAVYTNFDKNEQVNAAVKSAIESASMLTGYRFAQLRSSAQAARSMLTRKMYGYHYSRDQLRSYVVDEMNMYNKETHNWYGSEDCIIPKGFKYAFRSHYSGVKRQYFTLQAYVSSIEELTDLLQQHYEPHYQKVQMQMQHAAEAKENKYSSEYIARLLNIHYDEQEQVEGNFWFEMAGLQRFFSFDNHTVELLPHVLHQLEEILQNGKHYHYTKYINRNEMSVSFPTEMALPFIYTLDSPTMISLDGQIKLVATPKMSSGDKIYKPESITVNNEGRYIISTKIQGHLGFITPFDHHQYTSGYDKNMQVYLPLSIRIDADLKSSQYKVQLEAIKPEQNVNFVHYSTWPFTSMHDIFDLHPLSKEQKTIVHHREPNRYERVFGQKSSGMLFRVRYGYEENMFNPQMLYESLRRQNLMSFIASPYFDRFMQYTDFNLEYVGDSSETRKVVLRIGYDKQYHTQTLEESNDSSSMDIKQLYQPAQDYKTRQHQWTKRASVGIHNAKVRFCDVVIEFQGKHNVEYTVTSAYAKSNVDTKSRVYFFMNRVSKNPNIKPYQIALTAKSHIPNTNGLDFNYAINFDPTSTTDMELAFGEDYQSANRLSAFSQLRKSESRKRYLLNHPYYQQCKHEMEQGNYHLEACAYLIAQANVFDRISIRVQTEKMSAETQHYIQMLYDTLYSLSYFNMDRQSVESVSKGKENEYSFEMRFRPDFTAVNVSLDHLQHHMQYSDIYLGEWIKPFVAVHPVFHLPSRLYSRMIGLVVYRPICVVDHSAVYTFNGKMYPASLPYGWTLMYQYVPYHHRQWKQQQQQQQMLPHEYLQHQVENYAVYVRDISEQQKEVKIYYRVPQSEGIPVVIDVVPSGPRSDSYSGTKPTAKVLVNGQQIQYNDKQSYDHQNGYVQIYALPNGEVKIELRDAFYIIYDGSRVKSTLVSAKFRNALYGLCGRNNGQRYTDFWTPQNCIVSSPEQFIATYVVDQSGYQNQRVQELRNSAQQACSYRDFFYANVISDRDTGRYREQRKQKHHSTNCSKYQTRYVVEDNGDQICFTVKPLPVCKDQCSPVKMITKNVPVHCVTNSRISELWKTQIDKGASPDFSLKTPNRNIKMQVPMSCSA